MIHTFDVFDTLVSRRVATPRGVFVLMQQRLSQAPQGLPATLCERFARERVAAEWSARESARAADPDAELQIEEIDLTAIYAWLGKQHGLDADQLERLIELELEIESEVLYGVPETLARFHELAAEGKRLALISDMYLRPQDLRRLLAGIDPGIIARASLYLSSEIKLNKASGRLFDQVAQVEGVRPPEMVHIGDNPLSDYKSPQARGCQVSLFHDCHLTADERIGANEDDLGWQLATGLMREARLTLAAERARLGAIYAAPVLVPFVQWAFEQARARGYQRIYFLARDGQVLLEIARQLGLKEPKPRYLYVSRLSCQRCLERDEQAWLDWLFLAHGELTLSDLAYRLNLSAEESFELLGTAAGLARAPDARLDRSARRRLRTSLMTNPRLQALLAERRAQARAHLLGYLRQEGIQAGERVCLVDIGWSGSIQDTLHSLFAGSVEFLGLYWGLMNWGQADDSGNRKLACAFSPGHFWSDPSALRELLECFTAADHGSTLGYQEQGGMIQPILNDEGGAIRAWGLAEFRAGIAWMSERLGRWLKPDEQITLMPSQFKRLEYLVAHPTPLLAQALSDFPYSPDPTGRLLPFAPPLSLGAALTYRLRPARTRTRLTRWYEGSIANSPWYVQRLLASPLRWPFHLLAALRPQALLLSLPYGGRQWLKRHLPSPLVRAGRTLLRIG